MMGGLSQLAGAGLEAAMLRCAHLVTTATDAFREHLLARFSFLDPGRVVTISNGYDDEDLIADLPSLPDDKLRLTYAGTIFKLTSARGLLGAIARLHRDAPDLAKRLEVRFLGRIVDTELPSFSIVEGMNVTRSGYVPHAKVRAALAESHVNLCLLDAVPGAERIYPAKIFELMAIGRPILTLAPDGALANLMRLHQLGELCAPRDEAAIARVLARLLEDQRDGRLAARGNPIDVARYHRRELAGRFAEVLREAKALATR
jgi:glycosyltransferase involved in cell wall biosynthesis